MGLLVHEMSASPANPGGACKAVDQVDERMSMGPQASSHYSPITPIESVDAFARQSGPCGNGE